MVGTDRIIFGDYMIPGADPRVYQRVDDFQALQRMVEEARPVPRGPTQSLLVPWGPTQSLLVPRRP